MTDYTKTTNFTVKDTLVSGNPAKIIRGSEFDTEFNNIQVSVATKANIASPSFTGDVTATDGNFVGPLVGNVTGEVTGNLTGNSTGLHTGNVVGNVTGDLTGNVTGNVVGNVIGTASNADQLDNLDSTQFLRSDVSDTFTNLTGSSLTSNIITDNVDGTGNLVFERNASEKMRLTSDGKLGIGTTAPFAKLGVQGDIVASGNITGFGTASDIHLKENIEPITNALESVQSINGYTFNYKAFPETKVAGVIAQELEEVLPEVVYETEDGNKAVRYGNIVSLLIEAIKELSKEVELLKEN